LSFSVISFKLFEEISINLLHEKYMLLMADPLNIIFDDF